MEKGHGIWYVDVKNLHGSGSLKAVAMDLYIRHCGCTVIEEGQRKHSKSRGLNCFLLERKQSIGSLILCTPLNSIGSSESAGA